MVALVLRCMNTPTDTNWPALDCSAILYRLARNKNWVDSDNDRLSSVAFLRRWDEMGLSVFIKDKCPLADAIATLKRCHGVGTLHTGRIRDCDGGRLDVVADSEEHADIIGMPVGVIGSIPEGIVVGDEDLALANRISSLLAKQSRIKWLPGQSLSDL